jgi:hypothetical protein
LSSTHLQPWAEWRNRTWSSSHRQKAHPRWTEKVGCCSTTIENHRPNEVVTATAALNRSGRMFSTAPTSNPPALRPSITVCSGVVQPRAWSFDASDYTGAENGNFIIILSIVNGTSSAQAIKSSKVFLFVKRRPWHSYQARPISPPPRTCAVAQITPLWNQI